MFRFVFLFCPLFFIGCSLTKHQTKTNLDRVYISSQFSENFLSELPRWALVHPQWQCIRERTTSYLNFPKVSKSFHLKYADVSLLQHLINTKIEEFKSYRASSGPSLSEKERIFFESLDLVSGNVYGIRMPSFKRYNIILIDGVPKRSLKERLSALFQRPSMSKGHPILLSFCHSRKALREIARAYAPTGLDIRVISKGLESLWDKNFSPRPRFEVHFQEIFRNKTLYLYGPRELNNSGPKGFKKTYTY